jgi:peptidoglycan/xylan/chitin deacetylase (PgdA/CDA1 family)
MTISEGNLVLTYHEIVPERSSDLYALTCAQLAQHFRVLKRITAERVFPRVTFDDGHFSNYLYALPQLKQYGLRATFFVPPSRVENGTKWLTWQHLRELLSFGHEVQSHSWSHPLLVSCSAFRLHNELRRSKEVLEDKLGVGVNALSVPYGRWDSRVLQECAMVGYKRVYTSDPWMLPNAPYGIQVVGRLTVRRTMDSKHLERFMTAEGLSLQLLRAPYRAKQVLKQLLGDRTYHRLWCCFARRDEPRGEGLA